MERCLTQNEIQLFCIWLQSEEKSKNTIEKYCRDASAFAGYLAGSAVTKEKVVAYKTRLIEENYAVRSVNSILASLNSLFSFLDYIRLLSAAKQNKNQRLNLLIQTICSTGIRVGELQFITVEAAKCGEAVVSLKGKTRKVFLVKELKRKLLRYAAEQKILSGPVFITRSGRPVNRTNVWREMKNLCAQARINPSKVFPHNLRHLFARTFYRMEKDIAVLADILGHSSINTTRIYIITTGDEHRRRMENMHLVT